MIKIEKVSPGAKAFVTQADGTKRQVFPGILLSFSEADSLEISGGTVMYTVNETDIITKSSVEVVAKTEAAPAVKVIQPPRRVGAKPLRVTSEK
jgi:hypothetical protein